jgi:hypothetical protein
MTLLWGVIDPVAPGAGSMFLLTAISYWLAFGVLPTSCLVPAFDGAFLSRAALLLPLLARPAHPNDRRGVANAKTGRRMARWCPRQRGINHSVTQILTIGSRHASLHRSRNRGIALFV